MFEELAACFIWQWEVGDIVRIAVCEDEEEQQLNISHLVEEWSLQSDTPVITEMFAFGEQFLRRWDEGNNYDIIFFDVHLKGMDGVKTAKKIRERDELVILVFLTSRIEYVLKGYEVSAWRYLIKPVHPAEFFHCLYKAKEIAQREQQVLIVKQDNKLYKVPYDTITYFESFGHYVAVHTRSQTYQMRLGISQLEKKLPNTFFRCHRSYIINRIYCTAVEEQYVQICGERIGYSDKKRQELLEWFM